MPEQEDEEDHSITVQDTGEAIKDTKGKDYFKKFSICFICLKPQTRLDKHLIEHDKHQDNEEVKQLRLTQKNSTERADLLSKLRKRGYFHSNMKVLDEKKGELIVTKRPSVNTAKEKIIHTNYLPCTECLGFYHYKDLWRHKCEKLQLDHRPIATARSFLFGSMKPTTGGKFHAKLDLAIETMKKKELGVVIKNDTLLFSYGVWMFTKHETNIDQTAYIMNKLREMARVRLEIDKAKNKNHQFSDLLKGTEFNTIVKAVRTMKKDGPSVCKRIGETLMKMIVVHKGALISSGATGEERKAADDFEWMMEKQWGDLVTVSAQRQLYLNKNQKPASVPFTEDVCKYSDYIDNLLEKTYREFLDGDLTKGRLLMELDLAKMITFNKRRLV